MNVNLPINWLQWAVFRHAPWLKQHNKLDLSQAKFKQACKQEKQERALAKRRIKKVQHQWIVNTTHTLKANKNVSKVNKMLLRKLNQWITIKC